ncbi:hypothetical protein SAMN05216404_106167 [Nitrosospira multiformis]|uniref:Phage terminase, small subunit, putative, P27 family n=1 Tax=Nitrosospira multiformis TaxID=1231 RepID=A0A1H8IR72_9PROT|nr:hypothetical protein [Nitrosospira multiformis]SEN71410.1 hypothetical protein SAMN05216404_106167 [Nitrosospira multiformis]
MAKKSAASLSVVAVKPRDSRLEPPANITDRQRELWLEIVASKPADWFTRDAQSLLLGYVKAIASYEILSARVDAVEAQGGMDDLKDEDKLYAMLERQARLVQSFATKMRLTQQARYTTGSAATATEKAGKSRPWD